MRYDGVRYWRVSDQEKKRIFETIRQKLLEDQRIQLGIAFGSIVRRNVIRDVDVAFYDAPPISFDEFLWLGASIELAVGLPVDFVPLRELAPGFRAKVLLSGVCLLDRSNMRWKLLAMALSEQFALQVNRRRSQTAS